jgi:hypothetical protein
MSIPLEGGRYSAKSTNNLDHDFNFVPTVEETLKQHCRLLEAELQEMGEELQASR